MKIQNRIPASWYKQIAGKEVSLLWALAVPLCTLLVLLISYELSPLFDYNRWDNFEYHTPTVLEAHKQWLRGIVPLWNPHQHMGEPLLASGQPSVFYFPYTIITALMALFGIMDTNFCLTVILTHLPIMALGFYLLTRSLGVRPHLSWLSSISITFSGYLVAISSVWIFVVPVFTWLPYALLGVLLLFTKRSSIAGVLLLVGGMAMIGYVGHPQFTAYAWFTLGLFTLGHLLFDRSFQQLPALLFSFISAALLSAPSIISVIRLLPYTSREASFTKEAFIAYGAIPQALWGLINPAFAVNNGFIVSGASIMFYAGAWILPSLALGLLILFYYKNRLRDGQSTLVPGFAAFALTGILMLLFSLGKWGGIYALTHGVPVWSSFRWPHKFIPFAMVALTLASAIGLESYLRNPAVLSRRLRVVITTVLFAATFTGLYMVGTVQSTSLIVPLTFAASLLVAVTVLWSHHKWSSAVLLIAISVSAIGVVTITHRLNLKTYSESYATVGKEALGITDEYRVMPLSRHKWAPSVPSAMQEHGMFQSATSNNYYSLTGCTTDLIPKWYTRYIPSDVYGLVRKSSYRALLTGPFLSSLNVRYFIVAKQDSALLTALNNTPRYRRIKELPLVYVYERSDTNRRAFFATQTVEFNERDFLSWMSSYKASPYKSYVEGLPSTLWPVGSFITDLNDNDGLVEVNLNAPDGGFLVLAYTWYPNWRAFVDGVETKLYRVNGVVQGVLVPKGAKRVELRWSSRNVLIGLGLMLTGLCMLAGLIFVRLRTLN